MELLSSSLSRDVDSTEYEYNLCVCIYIERETNHKQIQDLAYNCISKPYNELVFVIM